MKRNYILNRTLAGGLGVAMLIGFSGCIANGDPLGDLTRIIGGVGNVGNRDRALAQSEYLYYPDYDLYYNRNTRQFFSVENNRWVVRNQPRNVSAQRVFASQAMSLDGYRSPDEHRNAYYQQNRYPRDIRPGSNWNTGWDSSDRRVNRSTRY